MKFDLIGFALAVLLALFAACLAVLGQDTVLLWSARADDIAQKLVLLIGIFFFSALIVATFQVSGEKQSQRLKKSLCTPAYRPLYEQAVGYALPRARRWAGVPEPTSQDQSIFRLLQDAFTYQLLDRALFLAVIYPLLSLLLFWGLSGQVGTLGQVEVLPAANPYWHGPATLIILFVGAIAALMVNIGQKYLPSPMNTATETLETVVLICTLLAIWAIGSRATSGTFDFTFGVPGILYLESQISVAGALACALAFTIFFTGSGTLACFLAVAVAVGGVVAYLDGGRHTFGAILIASMALAVIVTLLVSKGWRSIAALLAILGPTIFVIASLLFLSWDTLGDELPLAAALFLFLAVAPIVNAMFDVISYGITLAFTERGRHGFPILWGLLDATVAALLFFALGSTLVFVTVGMEWVSGVQFVDLRSLLAEAGDFSKYWWLYLTLFSTALPTAVHLIIAGISLQAHLKLSWRRKLCEQIDLARTGDPRASAFAPLALGAIWASGAVVIFGFLFGIGAAFWHVLLAPFLIKYRDWLQEVASWVGVI